MTAEEIIVKNMLGTRTIPWAEVKGFRGGAQLAVELKHGWPVGVTAILGTRFARRTFPDRVAADLDNVRQRIATGSDSVP